jgi:acid phosphatase type 7
VFTSGTTGAAEGVTSAESAEPRAFHAIRAEGLRPGTAYDYRVSAAAAKSEIGHFTTASGADAPFRFLIYGDSRTDHAAHAAVVRLMNSTPSDFLVNTGDMVHDGREPEHWQTFFDIERDLLRDRCVFAAVGNHELARGDPAGEVAFLRYFGGVDEGREPRRLYGSFRWSNTRFFLLNAMDNWTGEERAWLRAELERALVEAGVLHRIVVLHHGPFSSGPHGTNQRLSGGAVVALMRDSKVDLVIAGHDHAYERGEGAGLKYVISGGAGAPLYKKERDIPETQRHEAVHHFVEVSVSGEQVQIVARRASGSVIESCGFRGAGPWACAPEAAAPGVTSSPQAGSQASPGPGEPSSSPSRTSACGCGLLGRDPRDGAWIAVLAAAAASWAGRRRDRCA